MVASPSALDNNKNKNNKNNKNNNKKIIIINNINKNKINKHKINKNKINKIIITLSTTHDEGILSFLACNLSNIYYHQF